MRCSQAWEQGSHKGEVVHGDRHSGGWAMAIGADSFPLRLSWLENPPKTLPDGLRRALRIRPDAIAAIVVAISACREFEFLQNHEEAKS